MGGGMNTQATDRKKAGEGRRGIDGKNKSCYELEEEASS